MKLTSPNFKDNQEIPEDFTCLGRNINPTLHISDIPEKTRSFVLIVEDVDATPKSWTHWLLFNIPWSEVTIVESEVPADAMEGLANGGTPGYEGPCPKYFTGIHHYHFRIFALDRLLEIPKESDRTIVEEEMKDYVLEEAVLIGTCTSPEN